MEKCNIFGTKSIDEKVEISLGELYTYFYKMFHMSLVEDCCLQDDWDSEYYIAEYFEFGDEWQNKKAEYIGKTALVCPER